jgi:bacteriocin-like protein
MSKSETMTRDIRELHEDELKAVSGGMDLKGLSEALT